MRAAQGVAQPQLLPSLPPVRRQATRRVHQAVPEEDIAMYAQIVNPDNLLLPPRTKYPSASARRQANKTQQARLMDLFKT